MRTKSPSFLSIPALCSILLSLPVSARAQSLPRPEFEGFPFSWYTQPGKYPPTSNRTLCCPSKDKRWKKVLWKGHPFCLFLAENADAFRNPSTGRTCLSLVTAPPAGAGKPSGAQVQSASSFGYGSFRVHMATPPRENNFLLEGTSSAFYLRVPGKGEIGLEIRSKFQGLIGYKRGVADLVVRDFTTTPPKVWKKAAVLFFDPSTGFHSYGFDRRKGGIDFYADSALLASLPASAFPIPSGAGNLSLSHWTGDSSWTGRSPKRKKYFVVDWVSYTPVFFAASPREISLSKGGRSDLALEAGPRFAGSPYLVLAAVSEVSDPFDLGYIELPLSPDAFTFALFGLANSPLFPGFQGRLSSLGTARPALVLPGGLSRLLKGMELRFAALSPVATAPFVTNPVLVKLVP